MPGNEYIEVRSGAYYVAGTRIGLDVLVSEFHSGRSAESIFEAYSSIGSLAKVYGAIAFLLDHPEEVAAYLKEQERRYTELQAQHPLPPDMLGRYEQARHEGSRGVC
jgi:uncharacterized protein (DUF433 family)